MKKKCLLLFMLLILSVCLYVTCDSRSFDRITKELFTAVLSDDSLSLHYTLSDPTGIIVPVSPASLPIYTSSNHAESAAILENCLTALQQINSANLNSWDACTYRQLISWLESELSGYQCSYFADPLSPTSGIHTELPILLAEYTFRTREDVTDYLNILESIPACLNGLAVYEREKAEAGLFMPAEDAALVVEQCDAILNLTLLEEGSHFLQTTFSERLEKLRQEGILSQAEQLSLLSENDRLLKTVAAPAYTELADTIFLLADENIPAESICCRNGGLSYYRYLLKSNTGSSRTPEEIRELLIQDMQNSYSTLQSLLLQYQSLSNVPLEEAVLAFPLADPEEILIDLQNRMENDFPGLSVPVSCTVKTVADTLEPYTSPAFYLTPPIDRITENVIYINHSATLPGLELYTTLAHEGYPGHLYQTVYSQMYANSQTDNPVRSIMNFSGFVEGWAYYTENLSYDYASDLLRESGASAAEYLLPQIICTERNLQISLYCLLDLAIHCTGATQEDISNTLTLFGITEPEHISEIYHYIRREPTTYLKYYLGYLEILELQKKAMELWEASYTPYTFHRFLLENGPSDFDTLHDLLESRNFSYKNRSEEH